MWYNHNGYGGEGVLPRNQGNYEMKRDSGHKKKLAVAVAASAAMMLVFGMGSVEWGGREPHLAVVDPVCGYAKGTILDLGGEWTFATCKFKADRSQFFNLRPFKESWPNERKINVPGTWESQGVGGPAPAPKRCCYAGYTSHFPLSHCFNGNGWYRSPCAPSGSQ